MAVTFLFGGAWFGCLVYIFLILNDSVLRAPVSPSSSHEIQEGTHVDRQHAGGICP